MASSILGIGTSGLLASQRQLSTAGHNISNVNTQGYTRQRAEQAARLPQFSGSGYIGTGVSVETTVRLGNEFLEEQIRNSNSQYGKYDAFHALSTQIDNILANPDSGLTPTMESFFSALQEANDNPSSTPARQVLLTEANTMTERFQLLDDRFIQLNSQVNQQLVDLTQEVSDAARSIAQLNTDIVKRIGAGQGNMPNDLMDQREVLIQKIADNIDVSVIYQDDGSANLFIGSGQSLVIGSKSATLSTKTNDYNAEDLDVILTQGSGSINITQAISGGELQGVVDFKNNVLEPSRRALGRVAIALSEEMNAQHRLGMTIQGTGTPFPMGNDFFTDLGGPINALSRLGSTGEIQLNITDSQVLSTNDYRLDLNAGVFTLTNVDDNTQTYSAASIAALNLIIDPAKPYAPGDTPLGFRLLDPPAIAPVNGDSFLIRPTYTASADMGVEVNNVLDIALAGPVVSGALTNADGSAINSGTGEISLPVANDAATLPMAEAGVPARALTLTYAPPGFNVTDSLGAPVGILAYDPLTEFGGKTFDSSTDAFLAGFGDISFTIAGRPDVGDAFMISNNRTPFDDNRNGLAMAGLQTAKTLQNSSTDFQSGYAMLVSDVGTKTHSAEIDLLAQQTLREQAIATRESYSGVNLDEEAADLLKYQQAYQASARVISIADEMFQTLIGSV